jgi:transposase
VADRAERRSAGAADRATREYRSGAYGRIAAQSFDRYLHAQVPTGSLCPLVRNLGALRGLNAIARTSFAAAIDDPSRFASVPDFMAYLGLMHLNIPPAGSAASAPLPRPMASSHGVTRAVRPTRATR